jgi:hypothetical protein
MTNNLCNQVQWLDDFFVFIPYVKFNEKKKAYCTNEFEMDSRLLLNIITRMQNSFFLFLFLLSADH